MSILELKLSRLFFVSKSRSRTDRISDVEQPEEENLIKNELKKKHDAWNCQAIIYKKSPMQGRTQGDKVTFGIRGDFAQLLFKLLETIPASLEEDYMLYIIHYILLLRKQPIYNPITLNSILNMMQNFISIILNLISSTSR